MKYHKNDSKSKIKLRKLLKEKYGPRCFYCNLKLGETFDIEHYIHQSHGGTNDFNNLRPSCSRCNNLKSNLSISKFKEKLQNKIIDCQIRTRLYKKMLKCLETHEK